MSTAPSKPCRNPRCAAMAVPGRAWCTAHLPAAREQVTAERGAQDERRGSAASRGYGSRWREDSMAFRAQHPICGGALVPTENYTRDLAIAYDQERARRSAAGQPVAFLSERGGMLGQLRCYKLTSLRPTAVGDMRLQRGNVCGAPAVLTDHIIPHRGDPELMWGRWNWQTLCKACHDRKTAKHDGGFRGAASPRIEPRMEAGVV